MTQKGLCIPAFRAALGQMGTNGHLLLCSPRIVVGGLRSKTPRPQYLDVNFYFFSPLKDHLPGIQTQARKNVLGYNSYSRK